MSSEEKYKFSFFVIVDRNGKLNISDDEFKLVKRLCDSQKLSFYYIGEHYLEHLKELGFYSGFCSDGNLGFGYTVTPYGGNEEVEGFWTEREKRKSI